MPKIKASALVTIDTQNDFTLPGAPAEIPGTSDIIPKMTRLLQCCRDYGLPIIHIARIYLPDGSNVDLCRRAMIERGLKIVCPGSEGVELVSELKPDRSAILDANLLLKGVVQKWSDNEVVIYKPRWGAFYQTPLAAYLDELNIDTLVFIERNNKSG